jgi:hypothetical protein
MKNNTKLKPRVMWAMNETAEAKIIQPSKLTVSFAVKKIADHTEPVAVIPLDNVEAIVERVAEALFTKHQDGGPAEWEQFREIYREAYRNDVRAVLTAAGIPLQTKDTQMSTTPRTDEVYDRRLAPEKSGITGHELSKQLETELAAARAECERLKHLESLLNQAAADVTSHTITAGELARIRDELERQTRRAFYFEKQLAEPANASAEKTEAKLAAANVEIENLIWNLAGCSTIAVSGKPTDYSHELARPALHDVNKLAARAEKAEADTARLDWLQSSISLHVNSIALRGDIRDAIDFAMKEVSK